MNKKLGQLTNHGTDDEGDSTDEPHPPLEGDSFVGTVLVCPIFCHLEGELGQGASCRLGAREALCPSHLAHCNRRRKIRFDALIPSYETDEKENKK
ncbi:hypothetical protein NPIL_589961 [Nephila pilipes]|uniref:Uncharacterized protein n=1 Tax=Nephila pilipes TaxID=299642 RepID=A0A8X6UNU8_NEPPI|nr:hypothetical protein NPIL_589961 [Nephila pilipes]